MRDKKELSADEALSALERSQESKSKFLKIFIIIAVAAVVAAGVIYAVNNVSFSDDRRSAMEQLADQGQGNGYPYFLRSSDVCDSGISDGKLIFAFPEKVTVLDKNAGEISNLTHDCKKPSIQANGRHILLYDREGTYIRLQDEKQILWEKSTDSPILNANFGKSKRMALILKPEDYVSQIRIYDKNFKELFIYNSSSDYITDVALSDNGKYMAAIALNAENAQLNSKVLFFDLNKTEPAAVYTYENVTLFDIAFTGNKTVAATGDTQRIVFPDFGSEGEVYDYGVNILNHFTKNDDGMQVLSFSEYGSNKNVIKAFNGVKELFAYECTGDVRAVSCDDKYVTVLIDSRIVTLNTRGKAVGNFAAENDSIGCYTDGKNTYVLSMGAVEKYNSRASQ